MPVEFPTTSWSLVLAARGKPEDCRAQISSLCERYWYPLYAYLRRRGHAPEEAQDLTQEFFVRILDGRYLNRANPEMGRFRAFIMTSLKFFVSDELDRQRAQKRGSGKVVSLEISVGEQRYQREPAHEETPERIFERRWALSVLDRAIDRLREEQGQLALFERLKLFLLGEHGEPYAEVARDLNTSEGAIKVMVHRMRKRFRELLREEIADTVADPAEVDSELRFLAEVFGRTKEGPGL